MGHVPDQKMVYKPGKTNLLIMIKQNKDFAVENQSKIVAKSTFILFVCLACCLYRHVKRTST